MACHAFSVLVSPRPSDSSVRPGLELHHRAHPDHSLLCVLHFPLLPYTNLTHHFVLLLQAIAPCLEPFLPAFRSLLKCYLLKKASRSFRTLSSCSFLLKMLSLLVFHQSWVSSALFLNPQSLKECQHIAGTQSV